MTPVYDVDYHASAIRHLRDAEYLHAAGFVPNAGQLYGFCVECALKAVLVSCGVARDASGSVTKGSGFKLHIPKLVDQVTIDSPFGPEGRLAAAYVAQVPEIADMEDWSIDHRYFKEAALPAASIGRWRVVATRVRGLLDTLKLDGGIE
jgi:hypothetical protein